VPWYPTRVALSPGGAWPLVGAEQRVSLPADSREPGTRGRDGCRTRRGSKRLTSPGRWGGNS